MAITTLALVVAVPLQLGAAAGVELAGGYDSTVLNPRTNTFQDGGGLGRGAVDLQLGYNGAGGSFRTLLRNRSEMVYEQTFDPPRALEDSDFLNLSRAAMVWEPSDSTTLSLEGTFAIGRSSLLLGRVGRPDLNFRPGTFGEYGGRAELGRSLGETWRALLELSSAGRYAVTLPPGQPRQNTFQVAGQASLLHDFDEENNGRVVVRGEYFELDSFHPARRVTAFLGYARNFSETLQGTLDVGVDVIERQQLASMTDLQEFLPGPLAGVSLTKFFPDANFATGASFRTEFGLVSGPIPSGTGTAAARVGGGTGRTYTTDLFAYWRPDDAQRWTFTANAGLQFGETVVTGAPPDSLTNIITSVGTRYVANSNLFLFARWDFLVQDTSFQSQAIRRHVGLLGLEVVFATGESGALEGIIPFEELEVIEGLNRSRSAQEGSGGATGQGAGAGAPGGDENTMVQDPFGLSSTSEVPGEGTSEGSNERGAGESNEAGTSEGDTRR